MSLKKWNNLFTFTGLPYCYLERNPQVWGMMRRRTPDSPLSSPGFFRLNKAVVVACFDSLQVGCFFSSQLPAMTTAQQEKFNYTIFSFPGRQDISPSLTVLSHWGYNQTTLSWPLQVHKKGNLDLGNLIFPIKYAECSPKLHRTPTSLLGFGAWGSPHCLSWRSLLRAVENWATALNFAAFRRVSNFSRFKPMIKR